MIDLLVGSKTFIDYLMLEELTCLVLGVMVKTWTLDPDYLNPKSGSSVYWLGGDFE